MNKIIFHIKKFLVVALMLLALFFPLFTFAQSVNIDASKLLSHVEVALSPRSGSFVEGSTFQVSILLNTKNVSINGIDIKVNFDKDKLLIVNPTGGTSIIGVWVQPPVFDNTNGTVNYVGVVPSGITTESGLVGTITFKAKATGQATVSLSSNSKILLNDGLGTGAQVDLVKGIYNILPKAPEGVQIFSETHPIQSDWYNNNTPVLSWIKDPNVDGFSFAIDDKPNTIPDNVIDSTDTTKSFNKLEDGLWYFHVKASKAGVWGTTGHFLVRIDTAPPAKFTPQVNFLVASALNSDRTLVSFFTTDNLSGVDHYEVGIIDKDQPATESPVFVQADSPFQVPLTKNGRLQVIVRAVDKAGNVRDESIDVRSQLSLAQFFQDYPIYILLSIILLGVFLFMFHFLVGHHIIRYVRDALKLIKKEKTEDMEQTLISSIPTSPPEDDINHLQ